MGHVVLTGHVRAPVDRVFEFAMHADRIPEWNPQIVEIKEPSGLLDHLGASFSPVMRIGGRRLEGRLEVSAFERPRLLTLTGTTPAGGHMTWTRRYESSGDGTDVAIELDYELPGGFVGTAADKLFVERSVERESRHSLENFTAIVEQTVPVTT